MLSEVIRVWTTRKTRIYGSPSSMLAEERMRRMFVMHASPRKARVLPFMLELDGCASKGIVCEKSSKVGRSAKKQSLSICWLGYEIPGFPHRSAVTRKDSEKTFESVGNRKQAIGSCHTKAQGIVKKEISPGLAVS